MEHVRNELWKISETLGIYKFILYVKQRYCILSLSVMFCETIYTFVDLIEEKWNYNVKLSNNNTVYLFADYIGEFRFDVF